MSLPAAFHGTGRHAVCSKRRGTALPGRPSLVPNMTGSPLRPGRDLMHGRHGRPTSTLFGPSPPVQTPPAEQRGARHSRRGNIIGRLRRAYRAIEFPVGQVHYRTCSDCAQGVITALVIDEHFGSTGLGNRAPSHLRSRPPPGAARRACAPHVISCDG